MYASLAESPPVVASRRLGQRPRGRAPGPETLPVLEQQVCAEAGLWAPAEARRALAQAQGDTPGAVALLRVWAAALPEIPSLPLAPDNVVLSRRISAAYAEVPGGQWLGASPDTDSRLLDWDDPDDSPGDDGSLGGNNSIHDEDSSGDDGNNSEAPPGTDQLPEPPTRSTCPRVRDLFADVAIRVPAEESDGADPAHSALVPPFDRATRLGLLARGDTATLVALAALALGRRREAVLAELAAGVVAVQIAHPRTGKPCHVADVPFVEAEAVVDAEVGQRSGLAIGWGASLGRLERRAIALGVLDGVLQADGDKATPLRLDEATLLAAVDGPATNGFVEHLRLPHYASFASYLDQARRDPPDGDRDGEEL